MDFELKTMDSVFKTMGFALKWAALKWAAAETSPCGGRATPRLVNFLLEMMKFQLDLMNDVSKTMIYVFKKMN